MGSYLVLVPCVGHAIRKEQGAAKPGGPRTLPVVVGSEQVRHSQGLHLGGTLGPS